MITNPAFLFRLASFRETLGQLVNLWGRKAAVLSRDSSSAAHATLSYITQPRDDEEKELLSRPLPDETDLSAPLCTATIKKLRRLSSCLTVVYYSL